MEAIMKLDDFYIQRKLDQHNKQIRRRMREIVAKFVQRHTLKDVVNNLIHETLSKEMTEAGKKIFPIKHCIIRKVKTIKRPRYDSKYIFCFILINFILI